MPRGYPIIVLHLKAHVDGIKSVAALVGLTPSILRIWESRYGWPRPERHLNNNYRHYDARTIYLLKCVAAMVKDGRPVGSILGTLVDGEPVIAIPFPPLPLR